MTTRPEHFGTFPNLAFEWSTTGVLSLRGHTDRGSVVFTGDVHHHHRARALAEVADDRVNRVLAQLLRRYAPLALRQRLARPMNQGSTIGMALEGVTAADLADQAS